MSAAKGNSWDAGPTQPAVFLPSSGSEGPLDRRHLDSAKLSTELLTLKKVEVDQSRRNTDVESHFLTEIHQLREKVKMKISKQEVFIVECFWVQLMLVYRGAVSFPPLPP